MRYGSRTGRDDPVGSPGERRDGDGMATRDSLRAPDSDVSGTASPRSAAVWMGLAGAGALGFLAFPEIYAWWVPAVAAVVGWSAAAAFLTRTRETALAISCCFLLAVLVPLFGAWAKIVEPFLSAAQSGAPSLLLTGETLYRLILAGGAALFFAAMASRTCSRDALERYLAYGVVSLPRLIIGSLILIGIVINFGNVVGRYLFLAPIIWAEEIMIYIMVWMVFVGAVLVTWDGHHLKMDFFSIMLPSPSKEIMNFIATAAFVLTCLFVLPQAHKVTNLMNDLDQRSVVAEIPMVIPHFALLLGFALMFVAVVYRFRRMVTGDLVSEVDELVAKAEDGKA